MSKALKSKQIKRQSAPSRKPSTWSARRARALRAYRSAGTVNHCSK